MTTTITAAEYAEMAGDAYISNYGLINRFPVPVGWVEFQYSTKPSGFEAIALQNASDPNQIVISFAGTDFTSVADWTEANVPLAFGHIAQQLKDAADYYLSVQKNHPDATISFTGHSLGGRLAALMAVMFDKTAVTFDQAPFAASATASVAQDLLAYLKGETNSDGTSTYTDDQLKKLSDFIDAANNAPGTIPNAANVTDTNVQGEILSTLSFARIGTQPQTYIQQQNDMPISMLNLHSQALLTAFLQSQASSDPSQTLIAATAKLADLEKMFFDSQLFSRAAKTDTQDFLQKIVQHQDGSAATVDPLTNQPVAALAADAMVTRFTADLWAIAQDGGLTMSNQNLTDALIAFDMQKYYYEQAGAAGASATLFTESNGYIQFDTADILSQDPSVNNSPQTYSATPITQDKGYQQYFSEYLRNGSGLSNPEIYKIISLLPRLLEWYVQASAADMDATDTSNQGAFMLGGAGNDIAAQSLQPGSANAGIVSLAA